MCKIKNLPGVKIKMFYHFMMIKCDQLFNQYSTPNTILKNQTKKEYFCCEK